jgi:hypothetical protein
MNWILDLLTTYTYHLEVHVVTEASTIFTLYKPLLQRVILLQSAVSSTNLSLAMTFNRGDS